MKKIEKSLVTISNYGGKLMLNHCIERLLKDIYKRPGVYFGKKTLSPLCNFLSGYMWCIFEQTGESPEYLPGFQKFVVEQYDIHSAHHWSQIIEFYSVTEEEAFDTFYKLLNKFYGKDFTK